MQTSKRSLAKAVLISSLAFAGFTGCAGPEEAAPPKGGEKAPADKSGTKPGDKPAGGPIVPGTAKAGGGADKPADKPADAPKKAQDPPPDGEGAGGGGGGGDARMGDFVREQTLAEQEKKELAKNYLKTGRALSMELRYREALPNYERAAKLDPNNAEAKVEYEKCAWIVGDRLRGEYRDAVREIANERIARVKQAKIEMERLYQEGEILVEKQRYDDAVQRFERVLETLRWFPYEIDPGQMYKKKTEDAISKAKALQGAQDQRRKEALHDSAKQDAEFRKVEQIKYVENTLKSLMKDANEAFDNKRYEKCEKLCDQILAKRPGDVAAKKLKERSEYEARREFEIKVYRDKLEHYRRQLEWLEEDTIPYQEIFRFPEADVWAEVSRREVLAVRRFSEDQQSEDQQEINRRLDTQKINLNFDDTAFPEAIDTLHDLTSLNFVVQTAAKDLIENEQLKVRLKVRDITVRNALNLIIAVKPELIYVVKNGVVLITTTSTEKKQLFLEFYDVSDIINKTPDYPAPELGIPASKGASGGRGGGLTGATLSFGDEKKGNQGVGVDADKLRDLAESKLGEAADDGGSVEISGGVLIVRKGAEAHKKIQRLLEALRRTVGIMVTVEARFVDIQDNFLEQIGLDIINQPDSANYPPPTFPPDTFGSINRPLGNSGPNDVQVGYNYTSRAGDFNQRAGILNLLSTTLGSVASNPFNISNTGGLALQFNYLHNYQLQAVLEAIRKKQKARQINAPRVQVFNGQRAHMLAIKQRAYIQGVEVNQTGVIPVLNPVVGILNTGAILEVQPTVSYDKKYVTLEVKPTLAVEGTPRIPAPITLANGNTSIPIELPVITIQKIRSTVTIPDGGTVLIGGLKNLQDQEMESGVPFAMDIPLLKNLFRRQGFTNLKRSLVVLLKCNITIIRDEEANTFGRRSEKAP